MFNKGKNQMEIITTVRLPWPMGKKIWSKTYNHNVSWDHK